VCQWENLSRPILGACVALLSSICSKVHHVIFLLLEENKVSKKKKRRYFTFQVNQVYYMCPLASFFFRKEDKFIKQRKSKK